MRRTTLIVVTGALVCAGAAYVSLQALELKGPVVSDALAKGREIATAAYNAGVAAYGMMRQPKSVYLLLLGSA